jgi:hypothetical protein
MVSFGKESEACWNELAVSEKFLERLEIKIPIARVSIGLMLAIVFLLWVWVDVSLKQYPIEVMMAAP